MKKYIIPFLLCFGVVTSVSAQSIKSKTLIMGGGIKPAFTIETPIQSSAIEFKLPDDFQVTMQKYNAPASLALNSWYSNYLNGSIYDKEDNSSVVRELKEKDISVVFTVKKFQVIEKKTILKAPAYLVGTEAIMEIFDTKKNEVIYRRFSSPQVNTFLTDVSTSFEYTANRIISSIFDSMIKDFTNGYLYQPLIETNPTYFTVPSKIKKLTPEIELLQLFNQSAQVFNILVEQPRENWVAIFTKAQDYWKTLLKYENSKDKDFAEKVRFAAASNLVLSDYLIGEFKEARTFFSVLDENDQKFLGISKGKSVKEIIDVAENTIESLKYVTKDFENFQSEPSMDLYKTSPNVFEALSFEGSGTTKEGEVFTGKFSILNDNPPLVDWRTVETGSALGNLIKSTNVERNTVEIEVPNVKKKIRKKINNFATLTTSDGVNYMVGHVGSASSILLSQPTTERYSILKEKVAGDKISIFEEQFPYNGELFLKKNTEEDFYELPGIFSVKKSLLKYFEGCPAMIEKVNQNEFSQRSKATYQKIAEAYNSLCK